MKVSSSRRRAFRFGCLVLCVVLLALAVVLNVTAGQRRAPALSQLLSERVVLAHTKLPREVEAIRPQVARLMHSDRTVWGKATAVRNLLRAAVPLESSSCFENSLWFLALTRPYGLHLRMVGGSLNLLNSYDTHTTVEVWLPARHRWVVVDPTFGGEYTVDGTLIGAYDLHRLILGGRTDLIRWKSSHGKNATMPSTYWINPVLLFRYVVVYGEIDNKLFGVANNDGRALGALAATTLDDRNPPNMKIGLGLSGANRPQKMAIGNRPWYATREVPNSYRGPVVIVGEKPFDYQGRGSTEVNKRWVSPVDIADGALPLGVKAYAVRKFPASHES
jgi:hypothetical protein